VLLVELKCSLGQTWCGRFQRDCGGFFTNVVTSPCDRKEISQFLSFSEQRTKVIIDAAVEHVIERNIAGIIAIYANQFGRSMQELRRAGFCFKRYIDWNAKIALPVNNCCLNTLADVHEIAPDAEELSAYGNFITDVGREDFIHLKKLKKLNLWNNDIPALPDELSECSTSWSHLTISSNLLESFGKALAHSSLGYLYADNNRLVSISAGTLPTTLEVLWLNNNRLTEVPPDVYNLPRLRSLQLCGNQIPNAQLVKLRKWWACNRKLLLKELKCDGDPDPAPAQYLPGRVPV
jgi:Leucine-rich repeat (LRR) protein